MRLTLLAALVGLVLTCPAQAGEEFRFGGCQHPIEISRSGSLANLSRAELARVTPSLVDRVTLRSTDGMVQLTFASPKMFDVWQGHFSEHDFASAVSVKEITEHYAQRVETPGMFTFYRGDEAQGFKMNSGLRFDLIQGCIIVTNFQFISDVDWVDVATTMKNLTLRPAGTAAP